MFRITSPILSFPGALQASFRYTPLFHDLHSAYSAKNGFFEHFFPFKKVPQIYEATAFRVPKNISFSLIKRLHFDTKNRQPRTERKKLRRFSTRMQEARYNALLSQKTFRLRTHGMMQMVVMLLSFYFCRWEQKKIARPFIVSPSPNLKIAGALSNLCFRVVHQSCPVTLWTWIWRQPRYFVQVCCSCLYYSCNIWLECL